MGGTRCALGHPEGISPPSPDCPLRPGPRDCPLPLTSSLLLPPAVCFWVRRGRGSSPGSAGFCSVGRRLGQRASATPHPQEACLAFSPLFCPAGTLDPGAPLPHRANQVSSCLPVGCSPEPRGRGQGAARARARGEDGAAPRVRDPSPAPRPAHGGRCQPAAQCCRACGFYSSLPHPASW